MVIPTNLPSHLPSTILYGTHLEVHDVRSQLVEDLLVSTAGLRLSQLALCRSDFPLLLQVKRKLHLRTTQE